MSRRGENIFKRKTGLWEARYVKSIDEFGKKKYGSVYAHSYKEVKEKRTEIVSQISLIPQTLLKRQITLNSLVSEWLYINKLRIKPASYQKYKSFFNNHIKEQIGKYQVIYITPVLINKFAENKLNEGLSAATVNGLLTFIHTCMKYGGRQYGLPVTEIVYVKNPQKEMRVLSVEEQKILTNHLLQNTDIYKLGVLVALYTGIRIGELCALRWEDITKGAISVNKTLQRLKKDIGAGTEIVIGEPKSSSSTRIIPIPSFLSEKIEAFRLNNEASFMSRRFHPVVEPRVLQYHFKNFLKECGITDANFHALRHTFSTRCIESDVNLKTLSTILGHSDIGITANRYVHSSFEQKRVSMDKLKLIV